MVRVGVVGTGVLGRHHTRILSGLESAELVGVYDLDPSVGAAVAGEHGTRAFGSLEELAGDIDAAVVAAPTEVHAEVGCALLQRGIHLLVEKPIASSIAEADQMLAAAEDRVLAVGHVEFFNPAVRRILALGQRPGFIEVHRLAQFKPRSLDIDVVLDLMIHDLQILHALDPSPITEIRAAGINVLTDRPDIANARIVTEGGCVANLTASRVSAEPVRKMRCFLSDSYYSVDYHQKEISGFRLSGLEGARQLVPDALSVPPGDALEQELVAFLAACRGEPSILVDGRQGRRTLETALAVVDEIARPG